MLENLLIISTVLLRKTLQLLGLCHYTRLHCKDCGCILKFNKLFNERSYTKKTNGIFVKLLPLLFLSSSFLLLYNGGLRVSENNVIESLPSINGFHNTKMDKFTYRAY